jgi:cobalt/nickel transport system ATP-binding protein
MPLVVEIRNLQYHYDDGTAALKGVDFRLEAGETVALLGANGSGKTTFVLHLNGILRGAGEVCICGLPLAANTLPEIRRKVGMVFQDSDEQLFMPTVLEDVAFGPANLGARPDQAIEMAREALAQVGMLDFQHKAPYNLSAGEKRRVALAGVLVMRPEILVLDEPTTYLDPPGQRELMHLLKDLPQAKVVVTHDAQFARTLAARAVFFERGRVSSDGPTEEIIERFNWRV